jgi:hypothetical protein
MLSDGEKRLLRLASTGEDPAAVRAAAAQSGNPHFLFELAEAVDYDAELEILQAALDNPHCDLGTALAVFWLAAGLGVVTGEQVRQEYNAPWFDFCASLARRLTTGHYRPGPVSYQPPTFNGLHVHRLRQAGIAPVLFEPVTGQPAASGN